MLGKYTNKEFLNNNAPTQNINNSNMIGMGNQSANMNVPYGQMNSNGYVSNNYRGNPNYANFKNTR